MQLEDTMSAYQMFPYKKLVVWVTKDSDGWYCEITNRQGQDVPKFRPLTYATSEAASQAAMNWIDWYTQPPAPANGQGTPEAEATAAHCTACGETLPDHKPGCVTRAVWRGGIGRQSQRQTDVCLMRFTSVLVDDDE